MRRRWTAPTAAGAVLAVVAAAGVAAVLADEPESLFAAGSQPAFVNEAEAHGLDVKRLLSGPAGTRMDAGLAPEQSLLLVVSPDAPYDAAGQRAFRALVEAGATAIVADAFGHAGDLTSGFGIRFDRVRLVESDPDAPMELEQGSSTYELPLTRPTALRIADDAGVEVLATSSADSFLDHDGDGLISQGETQGPFPVVARVHAGKGTIVAIADPSLITVAASDEVRLWHQGLLRDALPDGGALLVDEGGVPTDDPVVAGVRWLGATATSEPWRYVVAGLGALSILSILAVTTRASWSRHAARPAAPPRRGGPAPLPPLERVRGSWTPRGTVFVAAGAGLALLGLVLGNAQATMGAALVLVAVTVAFLFRAPSATAARSMETGLVAEGGEVGVRFQIQGHGRRRTPVEVRDRLPWHVDLGAGTNWTLTALGKAVVEGTYTVQPSLRGPEPIGPLEMRVTDPLGLRADDRVILAEDRLLVSPQEQRLQKTPTRTTRPRIIMGPNIVNRAGDGTEFQALRDYQAGDSIRSINWKASARSDNLIVNQRAHESMTTVLMLLDARQGSGLGDPAEAPLNVSCRALVSIARAALRMRDRVRVFTYGDGIHELPDLRGPGQLHRVRRALADLVPAGTTRLAEAIPSVLPEVRAGNPVLIFSGLEDDDSVEEAVRALRGRQALPIVLAPPISTAGEPEAATQAVLRTRERTLQALRGAGVTVFETPADVPLDHLFRLGVAPR